MAHFFRPKYGPCSKGFAPVPLIVGLALSVSLHLALLFAAQLELPSEAERPSLMAELRPLPLPAPLFDKPDESVRTESPPAKPVAKKPPAKKPRSTPVLPLPTVAEPSSNSVPEVVAEAASDVSPVEAPKEALSEVPAEAVPEGEVPVAAPIAQRLPPRGVIHYRVDSGERNFQVGIARQEWDISDAHYHLKSELETVGIAWLFKSYRLEMESRGRVTKEGLLPEFFEIRRNGKEAREKASFDWERMAVQVGSHAEQSLDPGAQDFLSFNYQLGFMQHAASGSTLPLATGKKYAVYQLAAMDDEEIATPMGALRTLHLRVPGENIDLWLAYDYLLLPVKIRFVDRNDRVFIQVATQIQTSPP